METGETPERRRQREILAVMARINRDGGAVGSDFRIKRDRTNAPGQLRRYAARHAIRITISRCTPIER